MKNLIKKLNKIWQKCDLWMKKIKDLGLWERCKDWFNYLPREPYVRYHVNQASEILIGYGLCGTEILEKAVRARKLHKLADLHRYQFGYEISYSDNFYDHTKDELVVYAWDYELDSEKKGMYREVYRIKRYPNVAFHPTLKAYMRNLKKSGRNH